MCAGSWICLWRSSSEAAGEAPRWRRRPLPWAHGTDICLLAPRSAQQPLLSKGCCRVGISFSWRGAVRLTVPGGCRHRPAGGQGEGLYPLPSRTWHIRALPLLSGPVVELLKEVCSKYGLFCQQLFSAV